MAVCHDKPNSRATDATEWPSRPTRRQISARTRSLSTPRGRCCRSPPNTSRNEVLGDRGQINHESTESYGDSLIAAPPTGGDRCQGCGFVFNPTPQSIRNVNLQSQVTVDMGLGGTAAAAPGRVGRGHYATLTADVAVLDGRLRTSLLYGFTPSVGDTFQILTVNQVLLGQFQDLPEGAIVASYGDVALRISYLGGDGNDVVLEAVAKSPVSIGAPPAPVPGGGAR